MHWLRKNKKPRQAEHYSVLSVGASRSLGLTPTLFPHMIRTGFTRSSVSARPRSSVCVLVFYIGADDVTSTRSCLRLMLRHTITAPHIRHLNFTMPLSPRRPTSSCPQLRQYTRAALKRSPCIYGFLPSPRLHKVWIRNNFFHARSGLPRIKYFRLLQPV